MEPGGSTVLSAPPTASYSDTVPLMPMPKKIGKKQPYIIRPRNCCDVTVMYSDVTVMYKI
jgi:hypothetical protein